MKDQEYLYILLWILPFVPTNSLLTSSTTIDSDPDSEDPKTSDFPSMTLPPRLRIDHLLSSYSGTTPLPSLPNDDDHEDDESWMDVDPKQLEEMLKARVAGIMEEKRGNKTGGGEQEMESGPLDLTEMVGKFEKFVEWDQSGVEGAEFPG